MSTSIDAELTIRCKVKATRTIDAVLQSSGNNKIVHVPDGTVGVVFELYSKGEYGASVIYPVASVKAADGSHIGSNAKGETVLSIKVADVSALQLVEPARRPLGPDCTARPPKVGDRVMSTELQDRHNGDPRDGDAWTLRAGDVAVVQHVEDDGDYFQLKGGSGQRGDVTGLIRVSSYWSYADA